MKRSFIAAVALVAVLGSLSCCGSSGGGSGSNANNLTQAQAQQLGTSVGTDMDNAVASVLSNAGVPLNATSRANVLAALRRGRQVNTAQKPEDSTGLSGTYTCPDGGSIAVSGSFTSTGTSLSGSITETPSNCSDGTLIINGDPNMTLGVQASDNGTTTTASMTIDGGVSFAPAPGEQFPVGSCACKLSASATVNDGTGSLTACSISGSVCGQSINANCANVQ